MKQQAFHQRSRLPGSSDFERVFEKPARSSDTFFTVLARANTFSFSRLGLAVSRKVSQKAVVRNRIKRIVRESFRKEHGTSGGRDQGDQHLPPRDYVVLPTRAAATISNDRMRQSLTGHWNTLDRKLKNTAFGAEPPPMGNGPEGE